MRNFSPNIVKQLLSGRGWSVNDLQNEIVKMHPDNRITTQAINWWLSGATSPTAKYLAILGDVFGVSIDEMFENQNRKGTNNAKRKHRADK